jgi:hypothetical protein
MPITLPGPIDRLAADWAVNRTFQSRTALQLLAEREADIARLGVEDLHVLVDMLRTSIGNSNAVWAPKVLQAMLRAQAVHPLVPRAILQALVPGLVSIARRLGWGAGGDWPDSSAFFTDLTATTWEVITEWSGQDRPYALLDLLSAVRCRMRRQILRHAHREVAAGDDHAPRLAHIPARESTDLDLLARAIDELEGTALDATEAAILYGIRVLGLSMTELSKMTGRSRRYLAEKRRHAEAAMCAVMTS